jgi:hypothetical protein
MTYFNAQLKINGDKAPPCFMSFSIGKLSDKRLPVQILLYVSFKHTVISLGDINNAYNILTGRYLGPQAKLVLK